MTQPLSKLFEKHFQVNTKTEIPYLLTPEEEARAIEETVITLRNHRRWSLMDKGVDVHQADSIIEDIDWTTLYDREQVLDKANKLKHWQQQDQRIQAERRQRLLEDRQRLLDLWTAEKIHGRMAGTAYRSYRRELITNEHTMPLIKTICYRISDDPRYVTELGLDPFKGIMLRGTPGTGKTFLIDCIKSNPRHPVKMLSMIDIASAVRQQGVYETSVMDADEILYIDDVGTEYDMVSGRSNRIKHYGTDVNWFKTFIESYYAKSREGYHRLIISTNDSFDTLETKYGFRVRSRMAEMFNIIDVVGPDMRKFKTNTTHA